MAMVGIPNYVTPVEIGVRCLCRRYYVVYTGQGKIVGDTRGRAEERAFNMQAQFVDACETPFMQCVCGQFLDFAPDATTTVQ